MIDWNSCRDVERNPETMSNAWRLVGTRIRVDDVLTNAVDQTPEEIVTDVYPTLPLDRVKRVIAFARQAEHAHSAG